MRMLFLVAVAFIYQKKVSIIETSSHDRSPRAFRMECTARKRWFFTLPLLMAKASATCSVDHPSKYRKTKTSCCRGEIARKLCQILLCSSCPRGSSSGLRDALGYSAICSSPLDDRHHFHQADLRRSWHALTVTLEIQADQSSGQLSF